MTHRGDYAAEAVAGARSVLIELAQLLGGKRRADPRGIEPAQSSYVFVTPRRWGRKDEWAGARRREGVDRDFGRNHVLRSSADGRYLGRLVE